jgi:hypothetical protein
MTRALAPALALGALAVVVAAGAAVPLPAAVGEPPQADDQPLTGISLVCPQPSDVTQAVASADAVALPEVAAPTGPGSLTLTALVDPPASPVAGTEQRGVTINAPVTSASAVAAAAGSLAPAVSAQVTATAAGDRTSGLASVQCSEPQREWWFAAGSGDVGRRASLVLGNPAAAPAVVDVEIWTEDGPLPASGTRDLGVPARGTRVVPVDAAASGSERLALRVRASSGKVGAAMVLREVDGVDPVGLSWAPPSVAPTTESVVPALPPADERTLRLLNPGERDAIVSLRALAADGPFTPLGLEAIDVPAGQVVDVDLAPLGAEDAAVEVRSNQPVVAAAVAARTTALRDLAVVGTTLASAEVAAGRVSVADGRTSRLLVTAPAEPGQTPTPTASPSAPPETDGPASTDEPAQSDEPGTTAEPGAGDEPTPEPDVPLAPPVRVAVRLVGLDGAPLGEDQRVRVRPGSTVAVPLTLPEGTTDAWVVVVPDEDARVLVTQETGATLQVPDPLDPDATRAALWFDLLALAGSRTTVSIPPVAADVRVGLPAPQSFPE